MLLNPAAATLENDAAPARPPTESGGVLVGEASAVPAQPSAVPAELAASSALATLENDAELAVSSAPATLENVGEASAAPAQPSAVPAELAASSAPATLENDAAPARPPTESGGVLVGEASHDPSPQASDAPAASSAPATLENDAAPASPPTEPGGVLTGEAPPAAAAAANTTTAAPAPQRTVHLPLQPRLRVSYWFEQGVLKCEATLMNELRELVHRTDIDTTTADPTVAQIFSWLASRVVAALKDTGASIAVPVSLAAPSADETKPESPPA